MGKHDALAKSLAIVGTALVILPLLAPIILGISSLGAGAGFGIDYLMPFEIYPVTLVGVGLLVWASFRAHARKAAVGIAVAGMIGGIILGSISAQVTGIANSVEQLETWKYVLTSALAAVSLAFQVGLAVIGTLLTRDLFAASHESTPPMTTATGT